MRRGRTLLLMLVVGCEVRVEEHIVDSIGREQAQVQPQQQQPLVARRRLTDAEMDSAHGLARYDSVFEISGPTLLTTFPLDGRTADASEHVGDALDGYNAGIRAAGRRLRAAGVTVHANNNDSLKWRDSLGEHVISGVDPYAILYVFVTPDGRTEILRDGIKADTAILRAAWKHFGITPLGAP